MWAGARRRMKREHEGRHEIVCVAARMSYVTGYVERFDMEQMSNPSL